ncbi:MAG TPA: glycosyltransferase [Cyanothece sp. UBA12306]|nr:glycosyltransferase [Cyanothece sp. UBA12306]
MLKVQLSQRLVDQLPKSNNWLLLGLWVVIGGILRFTQLAAKPPWTDEFATMVFSLGNNFNSVPLNQVIPIDVLLQPLRFNADAGVSDVVSLILQEDNHPPLYFVLAHLWTKLFPPLGEYVDIWMMRSLPALLGILSIVGVYFLGKIAFRSPLIGQISAVLMAVSPYGIFLAQEARHYTLSILFVIASLTCLVVAINHVFNAKKIPFWLVLLWIFINGLGLSVHFFFGLTLLAEGMTLSFLIYRQLKTEKSQLRLSKSNLFSLSLVVLGTMTTGLVWMGIIISQGYGNNMITWIHPLEHILYLISPPFQLLAVWVPMISLLPVESSSIPIVIISALILLLFFIWMIPYVVQGIKKGLQLNTYNLQLRILMIFICSSILLFLGITYIIGLDITRGARYSFVYFPAVMVIVGASLAMFWNDLKPDQRIILNKPNFHPIFWVKTLYSKLNSNGKLAVYAVVFMGILGAITVLVNLGYQKYYLPDRLVAVIKETASHPVLIATTHKSLVQTGETMGIALELTKSSELQDTSFLLAHQTKLNDPQVTQILEEAVQKLNHPLEVWTVNFHGSIDLNHCSLDDKKYPYINGYGYQRYICQ